MDIEQQIEAIKQAIRDMMQQLDIDNLTDEDEGLIAQALEHAQSRITELRQEQQQEPSGPVHPPISNGVQLVWQLANGDQNAFINYLRTFPDPELNELANNPPQLLQTIELLERNNPISPQESEDGIPNTMYQSSNVSGMQYDPRSQKLLVKFHGENNEPIYQYDKVPPQLFKILQHGNAFAKTRGRNKWGRWWPMKSPSVGSAVNQYLKKGGYSYQKIR